MIPWITIPASMCQDGYTINVYTISPKDEFMNHDYNQCYGIIHPTAGSIHPGAYDAS